MRLRITAVVLSTLCLPLASTHLFSQNLTEVTVDENVNRGGSNYRDFDMRNSDYLYCQSSCLADKACLAWTFVREGVQGASPRCWLKNQVPESNPDNCCVLGIVR